MLKLKELVKFRGLTAFRKAGAKKKLAAIVVLAAIITIAGVVYYQNKQPVQAAGERLTVKAAYGNIVSTMESEGVLEPIDRVELSAKVKGTVEEILVQVGEKVEAGQLLMQVKNDSAFSAARQAELEWEIDVAELEDMKSPLAENNYTRREAEIKVEEYRLALEEKTEERDKLLVVSPFSGTLLSVDAQLGRRVSAGTKLATFVSSDEVEAVASFSDADIGSISAGMEAQVMVKGLNKTYYGRVKEVAFAGDQATSKFEVLIALDKPDEELREGMSTYNTVTIVRDTEQDIFIFKQGSGYIRYVTKEEITADVGGTVSEIFAKSGDRLSAGEQILRIANDDIDRQIRSAEVQLAKAEEALKLLLNPYSTTVRKQELVVEEQYERMVASRENAQSLRVTAPFNGTVVSIPVKAGDEIAAAETLLIVSNFDKNRLSISVDELDISKLAVGQPVAVRIDALNNLTLNGEVVEISQEGKSSSGITSYPVVLEVGNADGVKAGMSGAVTITLESKEKVLLIPAEAITTTNGRSIVTVIEGGAPMNKSVRVGVNNGRQAEITEGLSEGEEIVVVSTAAVTTTQQGMRNVGPGGFGGMGGMSGGGQTRPPSQGRN